MEEIATPPDDDETAAPAQGSAAKGPVRAYSPAVLSERQARVTDLVPVRPLAVAVLLLAGLTLIAAVETIHIHAMTLPAAAESEALAPFNTLARGSLASAYSAAVLGAAAMMSLVVCGIRAHRVDDYRGRYRVWLWAAAALSWLSLDTATGAHLAIGQAIDLSWRPPASANGQSYANLVWIALYSVLFGGLWLRLAAEIWSSLAGLTAHAASGLVYIAAASLRLGLFRVSDPLLEAVVLSSLTMTGHLLVLATVALYARHVYLDAQGRLKVQINPDRKPKAKKAKLKVVKKEAAAPAAEPAAPAKPAEALRFGGAASAPRSGATITKANLSSPDTDDEMDDEDEGDERLSKAERRRLKKLARRDPNQRRAA